MSLSEIKVDSFTSTLITRYPLPGPASWEQPTEDRFGSDHRGAAAVRTAGAALWHSPDWSAGPAQVAFVHFSDKKSYNLNKAHCIYSI